MQNCLSQAQITSMSAKSHNRDNGLIPVGNTVSVSRLCGHCLLKDKKLAVWTSINSIYFLHFSRCGIQCSSLVGPERTTSALYHITLDHRYN